VGFLESTAGLPRSPECPFCNKIDTELMNSFGSQLSVATYWCRLCRSPFEIMKRVAISPTRGAAE
jgi:transcription elongation factor Elf1